MYGKILIPLSFFKEGEKMNDNEENEDYFDEQYSSSHEQSRAMKKKALDARKGCW